MKIHNTLAIATLSLLPALASCTGDENPSAAANTKASHGAASAKNVPPPADPPSPDASSANRQPVAPAPAQAPAPVVQLEPAPKPADPEPPAATPAAADEEAQLLSPEEAMIPTQEEADLDAAQSIREDNADSELEKLEQELSGEGGG